MKRNWYAIAILVLLAAVLLGCKQYVSATAGSLRAQVQSAYAQTLTQQYPQAQQAFRQAAHSARQASKKLGLLVRRNALDRMNETMAVLPQYANRKTRPTLRWKLHGCWRRSTSWSSALRAHFSPACRRFWRGNPACLSAHP